MKRWLAAAGLTILTVGPVLGAEMQPSGKKIMDEWDTRNQLRDEKIHGTTHVYKKFKMMGQKINIDEKRKTTTWNLRYGKNNIASVLRYHSPEDYKDLSVLSYKDLKAYNKPYVVWQWEPDKKPHGLLKQVSGPMSMDSKTNEFAGTDFTFEDLEPEDLDSCLYRHIRDEKLQHPYDGKLAGVDCYVVEAYKKTGRGKTGYFKRVVWISKKRYLGIKTDFYDKRSKKLIKTLWAWDFVEVKPNIWRGNNAEIKRHNGKTWTRMTTDRREAEPGIPAWFFQPTILKITDQEGGKLIRGMWGLWRRVDKLRKEVAAAKKELAELKKKAGGK